MSISKIFKATNRPLLICNQYFPPTNAYVLAPLTTKPSQNTLNVEEISVLKILHENPIVLEQYLVAPKC